MTSLGAPSAIAGGAREGAGLALEIGEDAVAALPAQAVELRGGNRLRSPWSPPSSGVAGLLRLHALTSVRRPQGGRRRGRMHVRLVVAMRRVVAMHASRRASCPATPLARLQAPAPHRLRRHGQHEKPVLEDGQRHQGGEEGEAGLLERIRRQRGLGARARRRSRSRPSPRPGTEGSSAGWSRKLFR